MTPSQHAGAVRALEADAANVLEESCRRIQRAGWSARVVAGVLVTAASRARGDVAAFAMEAWALATEAEARRLS